MSVIRVIRVIKVIRDIRVIMVSRVIMVIRVVIRIIMIIRIINRVVGCGVGSCVGALEGCQVSPYLVGCTVVGS